MSAPIRLTDFELYGKQRHVDEPIILFAVGSANWDIYADIYGTLYSIVKPDIRGCQGTYFGDINHVKHLMRQGYWSASLTEYGKKLMNA